MRIPKSRCQGLGPSDPSIQSSGVDSGVDNFICDDSSVSYANTASTAEESSWKDSSEGEDGSL